MADTLCFVSLLQVEGRMRRLAGLLNLVDV